MSQVACVGFGGFLQVPKRGFVNSDILTPICETILSVTERYNFLCRAFQFICNLPQTVLPTLPTQNLHKKQGKFYWLSDLWLCNICLSGELSLKVGSGVLESLLLPSLFKSRHKWCKETDQKRQRTGYAALKLVQENIRVILSIVIWTHSLLHSTVYSLEKERIWGNRLDSVTV